MTVARSPACRISRSLMFRSMAPERMAGEVKAARVQLKANLFNGLHTFLVDLRPSSGVDLTTDSDFFDALETVRNGT